MVYCLVEEVLEATVGVYFPLFESVLSMTEVDVGRVSESHRSVPLSPVPLLYSRHRILYYIESYYPYGENGDVWLSDTETPSSTVIQ